MSPAELRPPDFERPTPRPELEPEEVHVWAIELLATEDRLAEYRRLLSDDERHRADRFHFDRHRRRYTVAWAAVRRLLSAYSDHPPTEIELVYGPKGKPSLAREPRLEFNLSHSQERALFAVSRSGPVGIDLERVRSLEDADDIARRFFSRHEVERYLEQPEAVRPRAFFNCWTRKEAFVKALGEGLFLSLDRFDVSLAPDEPARILAIEGSRRKAEAWELSQLEPAAGFVGALATPWRPHAVRGFDAGPDLEALPPGRAGRN